MASRESPLRPSLKGCPQSMTSVHFLQKAVLSPTLPHPPCWPPSPVIWGSHQPACPQASCALGSHTPPPRCSRQVPPAAPGGSGLVRPLSGQKCRRPEGGVGLWRRGWAAPRVSCWVSSPSVPPSLDQAWMAATSAASALQHPALPPLRPPLGGCSTERGVSSVVPSRQGPGPLPGEGLTGERLGGGGEGLLSPAWVWAGCPCPRQAADVPVGQTQGLELQATHTATREMRSFGLTASLSSALPPAARPLGRPGPASPGFTGRFN